MKFSDRSTSAPSWKGSNSSTEQHAFTVSLGRAVIAGVAGSIANSLAIRVFQIYKIPTGTAGLSKLVLASCNAVLSATGSLLRFPEKLAQPWQEIFHTFMGISMAVAFAVLFFRWLPGPPAARGMIFSLLPWFLQSLVVDPYMGFGLFGIALSPATPFVSLALNALFGLVLGLIYRPKRTRLS